jgi:hypothetical protein
MKKTYIQPSIEEVKIQANTILAGSDVPTSTFGGSGQAGSGITINSKRGDWGEVELDED